MIIDMSTLTLKFFNGLYFPNSLMDLVHFWYDNRFGMIIDISPIYPVMAYMSYSIKNAVTRSNLT